MSDSKGASTSTTQSSPEINPSLPTSATATTTTIITTTATASTTTTSATTITTSSDSQQSSPRQSNDEADAIASTSKTTIREETSSPASSDVRYGKCKWFNVAKGWGFITPNDGGQEVFVHQSVIQMNGFRSLAEQEEVEFECKITQRGFEATRVSGRQGNDCHGSTFRPRAKKKFKRLKIRCYNCGEFANHIASKCELGPQPKRCHQCKQEDHLFADCPQKTTKKTP